MHALRPSLRNDTFVNFVAGILVAALMLVGGPTAYAAALRLPVPIPLPRSCDGPPGTIAAPLGECDGDVTEADLVAIQTELWTSIFGTSDVPNLSYNLSPGSEFMGKGEYEGVNAYDVGFTIKVIDFVQAFEPQVVSGDTLSAWHVFAEVTGPTAVAVPVIGLLMKVERGPNSTLAGGMGFLMAGRMSDSMVARIKFLNKNGVGQRPPGGPVIGQEQCVKGCNDTRNAELARAKGDLAADGIQASAAAAAALLACIAAAVGSGAAGAVPWGIVLIGGFCALAALIVYLGYMSAATLRFDGELITIENNYIQCLAGCGIVIR